MSERQSIQSTYNPEAAICYGCGYNNPHGHHIETFWDGEVGVATFTPSPEHTAFPGAVYGGLIASLIDCHSLATAIGAKYSAQGREPGTAPELTCVTGNLNVSYKKPTPMGVELRLESRVKEMHERKAIITTHVIANDEVTAVGETVAVYVDARSLSSL